MKSLFGWLRSLAGARLGSGDSSTTGGSNGGEPSNGPLVLLERARALAREGKIDEAVETYGKIKRRHYTLEGLVEHAELLLRIGDHYGAGSRASRARELDPDNDRARAVQREILRRQDEERRRS